MRFLPINEDRDPKKTKETINAMEILNTINNPKSIIGLMSLIINDAKATIVVKAV